jgi:hypothetical protein
MIVDHKMLKVLYTMILIECCFEEGDCIDLINLDEKDKIYVISVNIGKMHLVILIFYLTVF